MRGKRGALSIVFDILFLIQTPSTITRIARKCHLNHQKASHYVQLLMAAGQLQPRLSADRTIYELTASGTQLLEDLIAMKHRIGVLLNPLQGSIFSVEDRFSRNRPSAGSGLIGAPQETRS
jgi:predicted transcriptional regulator